MKVSIKYTTGGDDLVHELCVAPTLVDGINSMLRLEADPSATFSNRQIVSIKIVADEVEYVSQYS